MPFFLLFGVNKRSQKDKRGKGAYWETYKSRLLLGFKASARNPSGALWGIFGTLVSGLGLRVWGFTVVAEFLVPKCLTGL